MVRKTVADDLTAARILGMTYLRRTATGASHRQGHDTVFRFVHPVSVTSVAPAGTLALAVRWALVGPAPVETLVSARNGVEGREKAIVSGANGRIR